MVEIRKKIRILHCIYELNYGGAEKILIGIISNLNKNDFEHQICVLSNNNPYLNVFTSLGVKIHFIGATKGRHFPIMIYKISKIIKRESIDLVHTNRSTDLLVGTVACIFTNTKTINTLHSNLLSLYKPEGPKNILLAKILTLIMNYFVDLNLTVSENVRQFYIKNLSIKEDKIKTLYSFFEVLHSKITDIEVSKYMAEFGIASGTIIFLSVGRLVPEKGYNFLLDAIKIVTQQRTNMVLLIAGDGPLKVSLNEIIERDNLNGVIKVLGNRDDVIKLLLFSDVFILSSTTEALPIAIVEAMSCGKAVIATNVGGVGELVSAQGNGLLIESKNATKLAEAITLLANDSDLRRTYGSASSMIFQEICSREQSVSNYEKIYKQVSGGE